jgi:8-oxo-dGTP diphosphatase
VVIREEDIKSKTKLLIANIDPIDVIETNHKEEALSWLESTDDIYRIQSPNVPAKHLVSYFILFDRDKGKILLGDHKKSGLLLPSGGHVEIDENPYDCVERECYEELGIQASFIKDKPVFITVTKTVGRDPHYDVSLWYVLDGNEGMLLNIDEAEFSSMQWYSFENIPYERADPHMYRFSSKLKILNL